MKEITRTITTSTILASMVTFENGGVVTSDLPPIIIVNEVITEKNALKAVRLKHGKDNQYVIRGIEKEEQTYAISLEDFMAKAKVVVRPPSQCKETTKEEPTA